MNADLSVERNEAVKKELFLVLLVDGSGSINSKDFNGPLKLALKTMVNKAVGATFSIYQFASTVKEEVKMEKDTSALIRVIEGRCIFRS